MQNLLLALSGFALVSSITPGPNNLMLMASGANYGILRTLPHMFGVAIGFVVMVFLIGMGLAQIFETYPVMHTILKIGATVYILYLAWKIATAAPKIGTADPGGRAMTFLQAAAFQWVNPKAWSMALAAVTLYTPANPHVGHIATVALVFGVVNLPSVGVWAGLGVLVTKLLNTPGRLRGFNITMSLLLVASLWPILTM